MAIRYAFYTTYNGHEYRVVNRDGFARLISNDVKDLDNGFVESEPYNGLRYFVKMLSPSEVGDVYEIATFALYKGYEFPIIHETNQGEYVLSTSGATPPKLLDELGFKQVDQGSYHKKVKKEEVDLVYEKKELLTRFFD